jgi:dehydrodolichyl diphosphate syntase complex subunit NUS1
MHPGTAQPENPGFTVVLLSEEDGREQLGNVAQDLASMCLKGYISPADIDIDFIDSRISNAAIQSLPAAAPGPAGTQNAQLSVPDPDLLVSLSRIHELDGYPPWKIRLTEIFWLDVFSTSCERLQGLIDWHVLLCSLRHYSRAEKRFGQ